MNFRFVGFEGGRFVLATDDGKLMLSTGTDFDAEGGLVWSAPVTAIEPTRETGDTRIDAMALFRGRVFLTSSAGTYASSNATPTGPGDFLRVSLPAGFSARRLAASQNRLLLIDDAEDTQGAVVYTDDGASFSPPRNVGLGGALPNRFKFTGAYFVGLFDTNSSAKQGAFVYSEDGVTWSTAESPFPWNIYDVVGTQAGYLAVGEVGSVQTWTPPE